MANEDGSGTTEGFGLDGPDVAEKLVMDTLTGARRLLVFNVETQVQ